MTDKIEADNSGTTPVRAGFALDERRLAAWMSCHVTGFRGPMRIEQFKGGQSNPTYKILTEARTYVLRRKPPGPLIKGAHAIEREFRVQDALMRQGFPVARVFGLCTDESVVGSCFYVMDHVEGRIFWDATLPGVPARERPMFFDAMNKTIAQLHTFNPSAVGLDGFGRPDQYIERQIVLWTRQYHSDQEAGRDRHMDALVDWLPNNIPPAIGKETGLVHGDFRIDNIIFHPSEPRILAVLDWELSTIGNPLIDFGYHTMMYRMPPHIVAGLSGSNLSQLNIPSEDNYVSDYNERTGYDANKGYQFNMAFNFFRLAAIFHGIKGRVIRGTASSSSASERAKAFPELAALAAAEIGMR